MDQERLIRQGAVPAKHFQNYEVSQPVQPFTQSVSVPEPAYSNDIAPQYSSEPTASIVSPYSSGNPIEIDVEAPQVFSTPVVDEIRTESVPFPATNLDNNLKLKLPSSNQFKPLNQIPSETIPEGAFRPFDQDLFRVESKAKNLPQQEELPSILAEKTSEDFQPELSLPVPPPEAPETNGFANLNSFVPNQLSLEEEPAEILELNESVADTFEPYLEPFEPADEIVLPVLEEAEPVAQVVETVPQPIRQTETVVEGQLYEDPIVLYARQSRGLMTASAVPAPGIVKPAPVHKPVKHQSIVKKSEFDPVYGLPLSNNVQFNSLPAIEHPPVAPPQQVQIVRDAPIQRDAQHLHVHIHHDYRNDATGQVRHSEQTGQQAANVQVVYRDDEGRVIMAPPTPTGSILSAEPTGDQRTYYVPPEQILRLKATSPIDQPRSKPSVATIQMRDTIVHGGTHMLAVPEYQAKPVLTEHGLPGINYDQLREAFNTSPTDNPLR